MFHSATSFNQPLSFDTSSVTSMRGIFESADSLSSCNKAAIYAYFSSNSAWPYPLWSSFPFCPPSPPPPPSPPSPSPPPPCAPPSPPSPPSPSPPPPCAPPSPPSPPSPSPPPPCAPPSPPSPSPPPPCAPPSPPSPSPPPPCAPPSPPSPSPRPPCAPPSPPSPSPPPPCASPSPPSPSPRPPCASPSPPSPSPPPPCAPPPPELPPPPPPCAPLSSPQLLPSLLGVQVPPLLLGVQVPLQIVLTLVIVILVHLLPDSCIFLVMIMVILLSFLALFATLLLVIAIFFLPVLPFKLLYVICEWVMFALTTLRDWQAGGVLARRQPTAHEVPTGVTFAILWRFATRGILRCIGTINKLRITRGYQIFIPTLSGHEAYLLVRELDGIDDANIDDANQRVDALRCVNTSRVLVTNLVSGFNLIHLSTKIKYARAASFLGLFTPTENALNASSSVLASNIRFAFRRAHLEGSWISRVLTRREALIADDPNTDGQNLSSNGLASVLRVLYGNYIGRRILMEFRDTNRLPTDESIVREFFGSPLTAILDNGIEHVLRAVANHYETILDDKSTRIRLDNCKDSGNWKWASPGTFAHQRMEQLNPINFMRLHMPSLISALIAHRGVRCWDSENVAQLVLELQSFDCPHMEDFDPKWTQIKEHSRQICGGVPSLTHAFTELLEQLKTAMSRLDDEAGFVRDMLKRIDGHIATGMKLANAAARYKLPRDSLLKRDAANFLDWLTKRYAAIHNDKQDPEPKYACNHMKLALWRSVDLLDPKDRSTLMSEPATNNTGSTRNAHPSATQTTELSMGRAARPPQQIRNLLIERVVTLVKRELRRAEMDHELNKMSAGHENDLDKVRLNQWYMLKKNTTSDTSHLGPYLCYMFEGQTRSFIHWDTLSGITPKNGVYEIDLKEWGFKGDSCTNGLIDVKLDSNGEQNFVVYAFNDVAGSIVSVQKEFMMLELEHGARFALDAFMEVNDLRKSLLKVQVISQLQCYTLDVAKVRRMKNFVSRKGKVLRVCKEGTSCIDTLISPLQDAVHDEGTPAKETSMKHIDRPWSQAEGKSSGKSSIEHTDSPQSHDEGTPTWESSTKRTDPPQSTEHTDPPQSLLVIGGGPTGLMNAMHCMENVVRAQGAVRVLESRSAYSQNAATAERAQTVRLDSQWVAMLRYHTGTLFENLFIPASGETTAYLGNILPLEGFIEIPIKKLEDILLRTLVNFASVHLVSHFEEAEATLDDDGHHILKKASALKEGDRVYESKSQNGDQVSTSEPRRPFTVKKVEFKHHVTAKELIDDPSRAFKVYDYRLQAFIEVKLATGQLKEVQAAANGAATSSSPQGQQNVLFTNATTGRKFNVAIVFRDKETWIERLLPNHASDTEVLQRPVTLHCEYDDCKTFSIDPKEQKDSYPVVIPDNTHVCVTTGKDDSARHFRVTTKEPYGICCMSSIKVTLGMHRFGNKRWNHFPQLVDDLRSPTDENTRLIGDFTKVVNVAAVRSKMKKLLQKKDWKDAFGGKKEGNNIFKTVESHVKRFENETARRGFLQTRFFETGDNWYLGMEFPREFIALREQIIEKTCQEEKSKVELRRLMDKLWFDATIQTLHNADVFNPGGRARLPSLCIIPSPKEQQKLGSLAQFDSFFDESDEKRKKRYEILARTKHQIYYRDASGSGELFVVRREDHAQWNKQVRRDSDVARKPNGVDESTSAISSFEVYHLVHHNRMVMHGNRGVSVFMGDHQSTPHFMRYSGLTGAIVNVIAFNRFLEHRKEDPVLAQAIYMQTTEWSNAQVVQRGCGAGYGQDGFLRPGFTHDALAAYLVAKVEERDALCRRHAHRLGQPGEHDSLFTSIASALRSLPSTSSDSSGDLTTEELRLQVAKAMEKDPAYEDLRDKIISNGQEVAEYCQRLTDGRPGGKLEIAAISRLKSVRIHVYQSIAHANCPDASYGQDSHPEISFFLDGVTEHYVSSESVTAIREGRKDTSIALDVISPAWKHRLAGGLVPRGLEQHEEFRKTLREAFEEKAKERVKGKANSAAILGVVMDTWDKIFEHAETAAAKGSRISSFAEEQPIPVDAIIDKLAVEAQAFNDGLIESSALISLGVALQVSNNLLPKSTAFIVTLTLLAALSVRRAFSSYTNISRYRRRNMKWREEYARRHRFRILLDAYSTLSQERKREHLGLMLTELLPVLSEVEDQIKYYANPTSTPEELKQLKRLLRSDSDQASLEQVMEEAVRLDQVMEGAVRLIAVQFFENSYIQESLTALYFKLASLQEIIGKPESEQDEQGGAQHDLFGCLLKFCNKEAPKSGDEPVEKESTDFLDKILSGAQLYNTGASAQHGTPPLIASPGPLPRVLEQQIPAPTQWRVPEHILFDLKSLKVASGESSLCYWLLTVAALSGFSSLVFILTSWAFDLIEDDENPLSVLEALVTTLSLSSQLLTILFAARLTWSKWNILRDCGNKWSAKNPAKGEAAILRDGGNKWSAKNPALGEAAKLIGTVIYARKIVACMQFLSCWAVGAAVLVTFLKRSSMIVAWAPLLPAGTAVSLQAIAQVIRWFVDFGLIFNSSPLLAFQTAESIRSRYKGNESSREWSASEGEERTYLARKLLSEYRVDAVFGVNILDSILKCLLSKPSGHQVHKGTSVHNQARRRNSKLPMQICQVNKPVYYEPSSPETAEPQLEHTHVLFELDT